MWRSLIWKEWREQRWRLAFGAVLLGGFTFIGLRTRVMPDQDILGFVNFIGGVLLPLMAGTGAVAPDRADGTLARLLALPVPAWHVLAAKAVVGLAACAAPVFVSAVVALAIAGGREIEGASLLGTHAMVLGVAAAVFTWTAAAGVRQPSEARAGLAGIAVIAAWCALIMAAELLRLGIWVVSASPFGLVVIWDDRGSAPTGRATVLQVAMVAMIWLWAARRFAKPGREPR